MVRLDVTVIDAIMGSGKSSAMINYINRQKEINSKEKFLVIVPYLTEIERYSSKLPGFKKLIKDTPPKRLTLEKYLKEGQDIICTHKLFLDNSDLIIENAEGYNLVIDEAINSLIDTFNFPSFINSDRIKTDIGINSDNELELKKNAKIYSFTEKDIEFLIKQGYVKFSTDDFHPLKWDTNIDTNSIYDCLKDYFINYDIYRFDAKKLINESSPYYLALFPIKTFQVFKKIYIMTYLWNAQMMKYYFDFYHVSYDYLYPITVHPLQPPKNGKHSFEEVDYILSPDYNLYKNIEKVIAIRTLKNVHIPGYELGSGGIVKKKENRNLALYTFYDKNRNAKNTITLSYTFYNKQLNSQGGKKIVEKLQANIQNFIKNHLSQDVKKNKNIIWSVFDCAKDTIQKNCRYINKDNYIPINAKATNEYRDSNVLIYLVNRYLNPRLYNFIFNYSPKGKNFSEDEYALSELVQWVWRSSIRDQKPISIYIASDRMRTIFIGWLNSIFEN